ncbi:MAG TPA: helix-turn-helix transcriptional regulator [Methylomusa anaerophila]|uniref:HTH-type transcriptional regulator SinR n=1 Tax=Methylomusa anaerophila TaxID=1930071 RepID=A0A348AK40_9FIRM|nr:helix-turn-helix transcriptional regulator [Methylomusa anaerophila]BBB91438.1 HTH-type transcriptional regulator SinR [Methylomusa anaerophila]HML90140.1 helix-turn-helix transcriptional regulator [Methylomusa anaerophila]
MNIGGRIREIRKQSGLKINQLAETVGIDRVYLSDIERGKSTPSLKTLEAICTALNISLSDFFAEQGQELDPEIRRLVDTVKKLTPEQREYLQKLLETISNN